MPWGWRIAVHIANPGAIVSPTSALDREAKERGTTLYLPEHKVTLFPEALAEQMSLSTKEARPSLSFFFDVTRDGDLQNTSITLSQTTLTARLSYEEVDLAPQPPLRSGEGEPEQSDAGVRSESLSQLRAASEALRHRRDANGARSFSVTEFMPQVVNGEISLKRFAPTPARELVSELMIAANTIAAQLLAKTQTPTVYRSQTKLASSPGIVRLSKPELSVKPKPHEGLGVPLYVQVTSPIRRYMDLSLQRQLMSLLQKETPAFDANTLLSLALSCEQRTMLAKKTESAARQYWMLQYFSKRIGQEVLTTVHQFEANDTYQADLPEYHLKAHLACKRLLQPGEKIQAEIKAVSMKTKMLSLIAK